MKIRNLFKKPIDRSIQGVVTIGNESDLQKIQELEEYVVTNEITNSFRTFFKKYSESVKTPTDKIGVWITGFFGSGKSHFLKILGYLLENERVGDKNAIDYFDEKINDNFVLNYIKQSSQINNKVILFNIDSKAKSNSKQQSQAIMEIMLRSFNEAVGLCATTPWVADLERILIKENVYDSFKEEFETLAKRDWNDGRNHALLNRDNIIKALVKVKNISVDSAEAFIKDTSINYTKTTEEFAKIVNDYTKQNKTRVIFLMDEVGQFIGTSGSLMLNLQTVVEDLGKFCHGNAWVVVTSQQHITTMVDANKGTQNDFSKIQGRFDTRILLSGANADEVIKKRILDKNDNAVIPLESIFEQNQSRLNNLIMFEAKPTWTGFKNANEFKDVYPFVSYQFELLQKVFEAIREHGMTEGKHLSQNERSLLNGFQEAAKEVADADTNILVPFDSFYSTVKNFIDYPIQTVFTNAAKRPTLSEFDLRVLKLLFMIKHVKEMPATIDRLSTLMVSSINEDKLKLREKIQESLKNLEDETLIQKNGPVYDFLTNEEQDVNRQINNTSYSEGDITRTIIEIIYDKILDRNKYRYQSKYDFSLNRYVDDENKGSYNPDNITIKVISQLNNQGLSDESEFMSESMRINGIVIDLKNGTYLEELIKAAKIENFRRNNSTTATSSLAEIMDRKHREVSERRKRAEEIIRIELKKAPIYANSANLNIREKDGKDRIAEAIENQIESKYYKLSYVKVSYNSNESINIMLNDIRTSMDTFEQEANYNAYKEILERLKENKKYHRRTSVKELTDIFSKPPYGWKELDVRGMIGYLLKVNQIKISIHDEVVALNDQNFKYKFSRGDSLDKMVVYIQEKIDDQILYEVKRIMNDAYGENYPLQEDQLKNDILSFFKFKKDRLEKINNKYGPGSYPGKNYVSIIYSDFEKITKSNDTSVIFDTVINLKDSLLDNAAILEQIIAFYQEDSAMMKNYNEAKEIVDWYRDYSLFEDMEDVSDIIEKINSILTMDLPFSKLNELSTLVFNAKIIKDKMKEQKINSITKDLNKHLSNIEHEVKEALKLDLTDGTKSELKTMFEDVKYSYNKWFESLSNLDNEQLSTIRYTSERELDRSKQFIANVIFNDSSSPEGPVPTVKRVKLSGLISVANKKVRNKDDINKVIKEIENNLNILLNDSDELDIE